MNRHLAPRSFVPQSGSSRSVSAYVKVIFAIFQTLDNVGSFFSPPPLLTSPSLISLNTGKEGRRPPPFFLSVEMSSSSLTVQEPKSPSPTPVETYYISLVSYRRVYAHSLVPDFTDKTAALVVGTILVNRCFISTRLGETKRSYIISYARCGIRDIVVNMRGYIVTLVQITLKRRTINKAFPYFLPSLFRLLQLRGFFERYSNISTVIFIRG